MKYWIKPIALLLLVLAAIYGVRLYKELTMSLQVEVQEGPATTVIESHSIPDATIEVHIYNNPCSGIKTRATKQN